MKQKYSYTFALILLSAVFLLLTLPAKSNAPEDNTITVSIKKRTDITVKQQHLDGGNSNKIFTIQNSKRNNRGEFRRPPKDRYKTTWMPKDLVYVAPGGLEYKNTFDFSLANELKDSFIPNSLSFAGPADTLVFKDGIAWGIENLNGDFIPYLLSRDFEATAEPYYEVIWSQKTGNIPGNDDRIYLNYIIKVPKESQIQWGSELAIKTFSFGSNFSVNAPEVACGKIFRFKNGVFEVFDTHNLRNGPRYMPEWKLPNKYTLTAFAFPLKNKTTIFTASDEDRIEAYTKDGTQKWSISGTYPLTIYQEKFLITPTKNFRALQVLNTKDGSKIAEFHLLPPHLPREGNSFTIVSGEKCDYLLMAIQEQSRILCFELTTLKIQKKE